MKKPLIGRLNFVSFNLLLRALTTAKQSRFRMPVILFLSFLQFSALALAVEAKVGTYNELVHAIRAARAESQTRVEQAIRQEKVCEAWETGKLIDEHILLHKEHAEYGKQVIAKLALDLGTSDTELYRMLEFARLYPTSAPAQKLSWSQYRELIYVKDPKERERVAEEAANKKWSKSELRREIKKLKARDADLPEDIPLVAKPGVPGTYRVVRATVGEYTGEPVLDLGFSCYASLFFIMSSPNAFIGDPGLDSRFRGNDKTSKKSYAVDAFKEGDIVTLEKGKLGKSQAGVEALYTYRADVVRVLDGDTLKVSIPLGFGFTTVQKLRLRGLDASEIKSAEGQEAKAFLEKQLAKSKRAILIKTVKSDKYDRYLADIWVSGGYLNQELIDEGFAVPFSE